MFQGSSKGYGQQQTSIQNQYIVDSDEGNNSYNRDSAASKMKEDDDSQPPCLNCSLIEQGSAISYGDNRCPQCGRDVGM